MTRPQADSERFVKELRHAGVELPTIVSPVLRIEAVDHAVDLSAKPDLIFTSENGVMMLGRDLAGHRAWAVGARTASAARAAGCDVAAVGANADELVDRVLETALQGPLLHLRGRHARGNIAQRLRAAGLTVDEAVIYDQAAQPLADAAQRVLALPGQVFIPLFSPRSAKLLAGFIGTPRAELVVFALSKAVAENWTLPTRCYLPVEMTSAAMVDLIRDAALR